MKYSDKPPIEEVLLHYGVGHLDGGHSGRYPWGSGDDPYQTSNDFLSRIDSLKKQGLSDTEIAKAIGLTTTEYRVQRALAKNERHAILAARAKELRAEGKSLDEIAKMMGFNNDSSVRSLLNEKTSENMSEAMRTAEILKKSIDEKGIIDVGKGVELDLGVSREKLEQAIYILQREGYVVAGGRIPQITNPDQKTTLKTIGPPGTEKKDMFNYENINSIEDYTSHDGGETFDKLQYPKSMDSKRIYVVYADEKGMDGFTGLERDGLIEIRPGVKDLSLGNSHYAQVRILVDDKMYAKGMAIYSDNIPDGYDVVINSNRKKGTPYLNDDPNGKSVFKAIKKDPNNPFGTLIKAGGQTYYIDENGKKQLSLINKKSEEGDWDDWSRKLPAQFLAKQSISLIKNQLNLTYADRLAEYDEICSLTNPTVKKILLNSFADDCDGAAIHLKAAALPGQRYQVMMPIPSMKDTEVYAPNFSDGEKVALVRFPHGGTFEIPILTVNNKHPEAKKVLGNAIDAIGINSKAAQILSGADFDGDTVLVIPTKGNGKNKKVNVIATDPLEGLKDFDDKKEYPYRKGIKVMGEKQMQIEMGKVTNLIMDMTVKGATSDELAKAVRHSMVVVDACKHKLDYKKSEIDNDIKALKKKYQATYDEDGKLHTSASTIFSRAKSEVDVPKTRGSARIDKETGEKYYILSNETYVNKKGETVLRTKKSTQMAETKDARLLSSGHPKEELYADYANKMKALGNTARKEMMATPNLKYSASANKTYEKEVASLNSKLIIAEKNRPKERKAQIIATSIVEAKKQDYPDMTKKELKKVSQQALDEARSRVGAKKIPVTIEPREWEAIQAGAISSTKLTSILNNTNIETIREYAMPKNQRGLSDAQVSKIKAMRASGFTNDQIANAIGKSVSTVIKYIK